MAWHARFPRAEIAAAFFIVTGANLMIHEYHSPNTDRWKYLDVLLASFCFCVAPFFHITAWILLVPLCVVVFFLVLKGRRIWILYFIVQFFMLVLFVRQTLTVCDTYHLIDRLSILINHRYLLTELTVACLAVLYLFSRWNKGRLITRMASIMSNRTLRVTLALFCFILIAGLYLYARKANPAIQREGLWQYLYPTDLNCVVKMISPITCLLSLAGLLLIILDRFFSTAVRTLIWVALPASLFFGTMVDFFMTRYMIVVLIPFIVLLETALIVRLFQWHRFLAGLLFCLAFFLPLHQRTHLIRVTEYEGFQEAIKSTADFIKSENGMALVEYPRIAAPLDLFYGVDVLPIADERNNDYRRAEKTWVSLMEKNPSKTAFFITPYERIPRSNLFHFESVKTIGFEGKQVLSSGWDLPTRVVPWGARMHLYRMTTPSSTSPALLSTNVYTEAMGPGNMGLYKMKRPQQWQNISMKGRLLDENSTQELILPGAGTLALFCYASEEKTTDKIITFSPENEFQYHQAITPAPGWLLILIDVNTNSGAKIKISGSGHGLLTRALFMTHNAQQTLYDGHKDPAATTISLRPFDVRWALSGAEIIMPPINKTNTLLATFLLAPEEAGETVQLTVKDTSNKTVTQTIPTGRILWTLWPITTALGKNNTFSFTSNIQLDPADDVICALAYATLITEHRHFTR